jgi:Ca2+-binding RTX toxin-like protein
MMFTNSSQKFELNKPGQNRGKIDWEKVRSSFELDPRDVPLPIWMNAIIEGTYKSEEIHGTNYDEEINGYQGSDLIFGHDGDDDIYGDQLSTRLSPDPGVDTVFGGDGNDRIAAEYSYGQDGNDILNAPLRESAYLSGGNGDDHLYGHIGEDTLLGGVGDDTLEGKLGADRMIGGRGEDEFIVGHQGSLESMDLIVDFRDRGDKITIPAVAYRRLGRDDVALEFDDDGVLLISVHDPSEMVSGVIAEVHGLDARQSLDQQIEWIGRQQFELIA